MNRRWLMTVLVGLLTLESGLSVRGAVAPTRRDRFAEPPRETRMLKIIHGWPDDPLKQDAWRERFLRQGFGGVVCNVSFQDYLKGDIQWQAFHRAVVRAREAGMVLWLYDERGYPSGTAGGLVLEEHPEWQARGLLFDDRMVSGEQAVRWELPPGEVLQVTAFPVDPERGLMLGQGLDLADQVIDRTLVWSSPAGRWRLLAITESLLHEGTHAAMNLDAKLPYPNLLKAAPTRRFLELTHEAYARHFEEPLGDVFVATFTDEPSLMSLFLRSMPYGVIPWDDHMAADYRKWYGQPLDLVALALDDGSTGKRVRYQFWQLVSRRVRENFFGQIQDWCRPEGVLSGGHLLMEENLTGQVALYGDFLGCLRRLDAPSIDCLTSLPREVPWRIARYALSAAVLEGHALTMCEVSDHSQQYRPAGDTRRRVTVSEPQIRGTLNRLMVGGINTFTSYYTFAGLPDEALQRLNSWVGRCGLLLHEGEPTADIAVVWPTEGLWTRTRPGRGAVSASPGAGVIQQTFNEVCEQLYTSRREFLCIDSCAVLESRLRSGALHHGNQRWPIVVLPGVDTLPEAAWERLEAFVVAGGTLIALGFTPANSEQEFPSPKVTQLAKRLFGTVGLEPTVHRHPSGGLGIFLPAGYPAFLAEILDQLLEPVPRVQPAEAPLRMTTRRFGGSDLFFLINDSDRRWRGQVMIDQLEEVERWDPGSGEVSIAGEGPWELDLEPYGAVFLTGRKVSEEAVQAICEVVIPRPGLKPVPVRAPTVGRGEFVRERLEEQTSEDPTKSKSWRASARLTRDQVDTFLFLMFPVESPGRDLSLGQGLVLDSAVPPMQRTPAQLLVVLKEDGGAEYLALTGRSLGVPGRLRTHVFWNQFELAGWSQDNNVRLDLDRITEIRVGWGGYYGEEDEKVEFTVGAPHLAVREAQRQSNR